MILVYIVCIYFLWFLYISVRRYIPFEILITIFGPSTGYSPSMILVGIKKNQEEDRRDRK